MRIALVREDVVVEVREMTEEQIEAAGPLYNALVDVTGMDPEPEVGWTLSGSTLVNTTAAAPSMKITKLALRQRLTIGELTAIYNATNAIPIVKILMDNVSVSTFVDLARPDTQAGIGVLVAYGLITQERATQILTTPPTALEKYVP